MLPWGSGWGSYRAVASGPNVLTGSKAGRGSRGAVDSPQYRALWKCMGFEAERTQPIDRWWVLVRHQWPDGRSLAMEATGPGSPPDSSHCLAEEACNGLRVCILRQGCKNGCKGRNGVARGG